MSRNALSTKSISMTKVRKASALIKKSLHMMIVSRQKTKGHIKNATYARKDTATSYEIVLRCATDINAYSSLFQLNAHIL